METSGAGPNGQGELNVLSSQVPLAQRLRKKAYRYSSYVREDHGNAIYCVAFCNVLPAYQHIFAAVGANRVTIYECKEDGTIGVLQVYVDEDSEEHLFACSWSEDVVSGAPLVAFAGFRGHIKVINVISQQVVTVLSGHGNSVNELKFHPVDPSLLFSASKDESIRIWNVLSGVCVAVFAGHNGHRDEVLSLDVHLKGSCFVSSGMDNTVKVWDLEDEGLQAVIRKSYTDPTPTGRPFPTKFVQVPSFGTSKVHSDYVDCVRMTGDIILSKSTSNKVTWWKPNPSRGVHAVTVLREFQFKDATLWFIKFDLDSQLEVMAVGNRKGVISVFDLDAESERPMFKLMHPSSKDTIRQVSFSRDGQTMVACSDAAVVWRYDIPQTGGA